MTTGGDSEVVEAGAFGFGGGTVGAGLLAGACVGTVGFDVGAVGAARGELNIGI